MPAGGDSPASRLRGPPGLRILDAPGMLARLMQAPDAAPAGPPATHSILELRDIVKEYEGNRVLKGVSLAVRPGTIHALVGENGAGKSTLMNVLFGMPVIRETGGFRGT